MFVYGDQAISMLYHEHMSGFCCPFSQQSIAVQAGFDGAVFWGQHIHCQMPFVLVEGLRHNAFQGCKETQIFQVLRRLRPRVDVEPFFFFDLFSERGFFCRRAQLLVGGLFCRVQNLWGIQTVFCPSFYNPLYVLQILVLVDQLGVQRICTLDEFQSLFAKTGG